MLKRAALLLCTGLFILLAACTGGSDNSAADHSAQSGNSIEAEEEIVIKATNYSFDQQEYRLKKGVPVNIIFENESGNHGILVPELDLQLSRTNSSKVIVPEEAGTFELVCSVMCGAGHSGMVAKVIVE